MKQNLYSKLQFLLVVSMLCLLQQVKSQTQILNESTPDLTVSHFERTNYDNRGYFESKINEQLIQIRTLLSDSKKEKHFKEVIGPLVIVKAESLCPSIPIKRMILLSENFQMNPSTDFTQLKHAHSLLSIILKDLNNH